MDHPTIARTDCPSAWIKSRKTLEAGHAPVGRLCQVEDHWTQTRILTEMSKPAPIPKPISKSIPETDSEPTIQNRFRRKTIFPITILLITECDFILFSCFSRICRQKPDFYEMRIVKARWWISMLSRLKSVSKFKLKLNFSVQINQPCSYRYCALLKLTLFNIFSCIM